jgi:hypothetical protein
MRDRLVPHVSLLFSIQRHRVSTTYMGHFGLYGGVFGITIAQQHGHYLSCSKEKGNLLKFP